MTTTETAESPPPVERSRAISWRVLIALCLVCSLAAGALGYFLALRHGNVTSRGQLGAAEMYQCPMHPTIIQDHPGDCPICGMKLVRVETPAPVGTPGPNVAHETEAARAAPAVSGFSTVDIDPSRQQLIGLRTAEVTRAKVGGTRRTVGRVVVDETRVYRINLKVAGFVERIYVDFIGKSVNRGAPLFTLYSPELLIAQDEFLLALQNRGLVQDVTGVPSGDGETLVNAARRKLELWDVPAKTIDQIAQTRQSIRTITFHSPVKGVVTKKDVVQGMRLDAGAMPYEVVDLSHVWVVADVYESELRFVKQGMPATLTLNAFPNRVFRGKTAFIDPMLNPMTRTVEVRIAFPNPNGELKPQMFGEVVLDSSPRDVLAIPQDAVIHSGTRHLVFVAIGNGRFEPREVRLGESDGDRVEVVTGLAAGERVVTRANFLIDSESRLRASLAELTGAGQSLQPESARVLPATDGSAPQRPPASDSSRGADTNRATPASEPAPSASAPPGVHAGHGAHAR